MTSSKSLVLVTGANQGIGFAVAQAFAMLDKYHISINARSPSNAQAAVKQLQEEASNKTALTAITLNVTNNASIEAATKDISDKDRPSSQGVNVTSGLGLISMARKKGYAFNANT
ncbi:hypothetical protein F4820DRAFT_450226 [Hypoxylon rubiginosum]|uniref:Uncharacterized protein n=1 Tax=Hypoxylon rubiginosum TaxID=110542 RepID=A0ACB9YX33_9PEZI|nr:hypothetical protein F4820DRAFT_450226 [Hypoxylon rubiginosum]